MGNKTTKESVQPRQMGSVDSRTSCSSTKDYTGKQRVTIVIQTGVDEDFRYECAGEKHIFDIFVMVCTELRLDFQRYQLWDNSKSVRVELNEPCSKLDMIPLRLEVIDTGKLAEQLRTHTKDYECLCKAFDEWKKQYEHKQRLSDSVENDLALIRKFMKRIDASRRHASENIYYLRLLGKMQECRVRAEDSDAILCSDDETPVVEHQLASEYRYRDRSRSYHSSTSSECSLLSSCISNIVPPSGPPCKVNDPMHISDMFAPAPRFVDTY
eukprot:Clim_evm63s215 gene=Clim_evmTU63s215